MKRLFVLSALGLALVSGCSGASPAKPKWGVALEGEPIAPEQIADAARDAGLNPAFVVFFLAWPEEPRAGGFPRASIETITASGAEPVITWEPMFYRRADGAETMVSAEAIVRGDYDRYLMAFAEEAAKWRRPLYLRFAHEMNLSRYHWGGTAADYGANSPEKFRAMWRHVVDLFRRAKATNVRWVFCPNCESVPGAGNPAAAPWNTARNYYPGDDYVDVLGMDGYNWGDTQTPAKNGWQSSWRSFESVFGALHGELRALAPAKPLYVFETASAASGGDKARWLAEMAATATAWKLDGVVWFEVRKEIDWRLLTGVQSPALRPLRESFGGVSP